MKDIRYSANITPNVFNYVLDRPSKLDLNKPICVEVNGDKVIGIVFAKGISIEIGHELTKDDEVIICYHEKEDFQAIPLYTTCLLEK